MAPDEALGYDPQTLPSRGRRGKSLGSQIATQISTSDPAQALCGALLAAAPFVLVVTLRTYPPLEAGGAPLAFIAGISSAALLIVGSLSLEYLPRTARTLVTIGIATGAGLAVPTLANSPSLSLLALAGTALALHVLWPSAARRIATPDPRLTALARARVASLVAAGAWLVRAAEEIAPTVDFILAASSAFMLAGLSGLVSIPRMRRSIGRKLIAALFAAATVGLALAGSFGSTVTVLHGAAFAALALAAFARPLPQSKAVETSALDLIAGHPSRLLVVTFLALCALTTFGLSLPACTTGTTPPRLLDLLFTSVSAVCVTGLTVLDTPEAFTRAGQAVILVGIQLGGLGIMTFSTIGIRILGRRMSLRHEAAVAHILSVSDRSKLLRATMTVVVVTFVTEAIGATVLSLLFFRDGFSLGEATWRGIFTSVSAFCNAGFALESDSFVSHRTSPLILHSVAALTILGGISPVAIVALVTPRKGPLHPAVKLMFIATAILLVLGTLLFASFEWNNSLEPLSPVDRLHNAWFQSATFRTAGFNSIDVSSAHPAAITIMMLWMFIGGSPASTAGGIKVTTAAVLLLAVVAAIRGVPHATVFGRAIGHRTVYRAAAVATLGLASGIIGFIALILTQEMPAREALFEVVSALGTVGLSIGGTPDLDELGKAIIIACMFLGRVGPLTLFLFLSHQVRGQSWRHPELELTVG